jgi:hypothetical protein
MNRFSNDASVIDEDFFTGAWPAHRGRNGIESTDTRTNLWLLRRILWFLQAGASLSSYAAVAQSA